MTVPHSPRRAQLAAAVLVALVVACLSAAAGPAAAQDPPQGPVPDATPDATPGATPGATQDANLGTAMLECAAIKPLFERLRCYDRLARDVDTFQTVVRETCGEPAGDPALDAVRRRQNLQDVVAALRQGQQDLAGGAGGQQLQVLRDTQVSGIDLTPNWKVDEVRDADGNPVEVRLSTAAQAPLVEGGTPPTFNILCRQGNTMMWLEAGIAGSGDTTAVRFAFGGEAEPATLTLANTANGLAMGIWGGAESALLPMLKQTAMTASFVPKEAEEMTRIGFDLTGFETAIDVIRLQCGW